MNHDSLAFVRDPEAASTSQNGRSSAITIAVDTWPLLAQFRNSGIYVYTKNLLSHFQEMAAEDSVRVTPLISPSRPNDANKFATSKGFEPQETSFFRIGRVWRYGGACLAARINKADLLFCPSGTTLPVGGLVPVVATIHDATPFLLHTFPNRLARGLRLAFTTTAKNSAAIITDSICSKKDLVNVLGLPESRVHVVYLACDQTMFNVVTPDMQLQEALLKKLGLRRPYIFHHGTIQPRKNIKRLIEAYRLALARNTNLELDLVLAGDVGWQYQEILATAKENGPGRVVLTGPISDPELSILLKAAAMAVIPSLYEGFCLPLLEAMSCGTPTICSNASCLPEISNGALLYFDPASVDEMAVRIEEVLEDRELRQKLSSCGLERASFFNWRRCACETMAVLKAVALN